MNEDPTQIPFESPLVPKILQSSAEIQFNCYPGISCFNACCKQSDITLAPYDVIRLKARLGMNSSAFLKKYTVPFEMDGHGMPGIKLRTEEENPVCLLMSEQGCSVYEDRPTACRYYPLGLMSMKKKDKKKAQAEYYRVVEDHCKGHEQERFISVEDYRKEQKVQEFDDLNSE